MESTAHKLSDGESNDAYRNNYAHTYSFDTGKPTWLYLQSDKVFSVTIWVT